MLKGAFEAPVRLASFLAAQDLLVIRGEVRVRGPGEATLLLSAVNITAVFESLDDAIFIVNAKRELHWMNRAAQSLSGGLLEELVGQSCEMLFERRLCGSACGFCDQTIEPRTYKSVFNVGDGQTRTGELTVTPLCSLAGEPVGVVVRIHRFTIQELEPQASRSRRIGASRPTGFRSLVGRDEAMLSLYDSIREVAISNVPVVVTGETGTGKEMVAQAIHAESSRVSAPFVAVNCGALSDGLLESELFGHVRGAFTGAYGDKKGRFQLAEGGTLFLDEVGELTLATQVKLLRVLQERVMRPVGSEKMVTVDVRVVAATNRDLKSLVRSGKFREDLYFRLCVVPLSVPALRHRRSDIILVANALLVRYAAELDRALPEISPTAERLLERWAWPGNVRELANAMQYALVKQPGPLIRPEHLPADIARDWLPDTKKRPVGRRPSLTYEQVRKALHQVDGNKAKAARLLGVGRSTIYRYCDEFVRG